MEHTPIQSQPSQIKRSSFAKNRNVVIAVVIAVVAILLVVNFQPALQTCELIEGIDLKPHEVQRMQIALTQEGLNDFEIRESRIWVPRNLRPTYVQAVTNAGVLPEELHLHNETQAGLGSLFVSEDQRRKMARDEKNKHIQAMLGKLAFVEQAWFKMDIAKATNAFQEDVTSALVVIKPRKETKLGSQQVETIREVVFGGIAGISRDQIVITDLNADTAYRFDDAVTPMQTRGLNASFSNTAQFLRNDLENQIRELLDDYEGVDVVVRITSINKEELVHEPPQDRIASLKPELFQVGTNGQATAPMHIARSEVKPKTVLIAEPNVAILVSFPESVVLNTLNEVEEGSITEMRKSEAYRERFNHLKSDINRRIRPIIDTAGFASNDPRISVTVKQMESNQPVVAEEPWYNELVKRAGGPLGVLAIGFCGILIVGFVFSGARRETPVLHSNQQPAISVVNSDSEDMADDQAIKNEISMLIEEDPEAAAQVIKRWIRGAA